MHIVYVQGKFAKMIDHAIMLGKARQGKVESVGVKWHRMNLICTDNDVEVRVSLNDCVH